MKIHRASLETCSNASDMVVVIDVLRAFTTSAYLFQAGVEEIILVSGVEKAFALKSQMPDCVIAGEVNGITVPGFDMGNSPSSIKPQEIAGKRVSSEQPPERRGLPAPDMPARFSQLH